MVLHDIERELAEQRFGALKIPMNDTNRKGESLVLNYNSVNEKIRYYSINYNSVNKKIRYYSIGEIIKASRKDKNGN